jgi:hypothetical protein
MQPGLRVRWCLGLAQACPPRQRCCRCRGNVEMAGRCAAEDAAGVDGENGNRCNCVSSMLLPYLPSTSCKIHDELHAVNSQQYHQAATAAPKPPRIVHSSPNAATTPLQQVLSCLSLLLHGRSILTRTVPAVSAEPPLAAPNCQSAAHQQQHHHPYYLRHRLPSLLLLLQLYLFLLSHQAMAAS